MFRLALVAVVILLIAAACGGGGSDELSDVAEATPVPASTVSRDSADKPEATAVPTAIAVRDDNGGSGLTEPDLLEYCGEVSLLDDEITDDDPETWGEAERLVVSLRGTLGGMTPPEALKDYHSALISLYKGLHDIYRSKDPNEPYDNGEVIVEPAHTILVVGALRALKELDEETKLTLEGHDCGFGPDALESLTWRMYNWSRHS